MAEGLVNAGSQDATLNALNARTGEKVWSYTTGGSIISTPGVANGFLYVGSNDQSLYAFNQLHIMRG